MKARILSITFIGLLFLLMGCSDHEEHSTQGNLNAEIWNLKNVSGGFTGLDVNYDKGLVTWSFDKEASLLSVKSSKLISANKSNFLPLQDGNYTFELKDFDDKTYIFINGAGYSGENSYGSFHIDTTGELIVNQNEAPEAFVYDALILRLEK